MKRSLALITVLAILCLSLCSCELVKSPEFYELSDEDNVPSLTKVVGDRKVDTMQVSKQYVKYVYKNLTDITGDVETYANYLVKNEKYSKGNQKIKNIDSTGEIVLTKKSPSDSEFLISVKIKWTESKITIEADRSSTIV